MSATIKTARTTSITAAFFLSVGFGAPQAPVQIVTNLEWSGRGVWLAADFHTHTRFTDGAHTVDEVVAAAARSGCDAVAVTDHGDANLKGGTPEYVEAIRKARAQNANVTVLTGLEWNVPPGKGQEHATVLFPPQMETAETLTAFRERFDDQTKIGEDAELALEGLAALSPSERSTPAPVVFFNHPSRRPDSSSAPRLTLERLMDAAPSVLVGFEGAPGHQRGAPVGAYPPGVMLVNRWDPLAADVGGAWDQWLGKGLNVWAAMASSDFHNERDDFWPCEFATTWVYAPDRSIEGVIRAMRAGSFFAEHGHIVSAVELLTQFDGQSLPVRPGQVVSTRAGTKAAVSMRMKIPAVDFAGRENHIDTVELLGTSADRTSILFSGSPGADVAFKTTITVPAGGIVLRARGLRNVIGEPALMFYTNPIRILAR